MATDKALVGATGVHYVAFQLSSRGYAVGLTAPGVKGVDLLATGAETGKSISIQVKTMTDAKRKTRGVHWSWRIGKHLADGEGHKDFFLTFVDLRGGPPTEPDVPWNPDVFIVPSAGLDRFVWPYPEKKPRMFWFVMPVKDAYKYRNKWDHIEKALA